MKYRLKKFPLIRLLLLYFILLLSEKSIFYSKNMQYAYTFYGKDLHVNVCRGDLEPSQTSMVDLLFKNHKKALL